MTRRALILDFDGVLVDSEPVHFASWTRTFAEMMDIKLEGDHRVLFGRSVDDLYLLWTQRELEAELKQQLLTRKTDLFFEIGAERLTPMPGALDLIRSAHAHGWYVAVVSRALRRRLFRTLEVMGMPALFDLVLGAEDAVDPKTRRKDYGCVARIFGIDPAACIVIEDSVGGIEDALAAHIGRVIGMASTFEAQILVEAGAHEVVAQLSEIVL